MASLNLERCAGLIDYSKEGDGLDDDSVRSRVTGSGLGSWAGVGFVSLAAVMLVLSMLGGGVASVV